MAIQLEELVARLRLDDSGFNTNAVSSKLAGAGKKMTSAGRTMTTGLTLPIVGAAAASVKLAGDFDASMRQIAIATGGSTDQLEQLALTMGQKTKFSAGEAADAMLELAKSGMSAATIQGGALESTMTLAAAGGVELGDAATYVSNSMNAFGLEADDARGIAVALAGGANASSASVESLGQGLAQSSAAAHTAGLSLQETVAALSALDAQGIKGSDAGTSLKTMLTALVPATKKSKDEMERLGLSFQDSNGNMDNLETVAGKLQDTFGDMSEAQRIASLRTIFGSDAFRAANALVETGEKGIRKYTKATKDETAANKLADASMQGINGSIERAKGSLETAGILIGQSLAPVIEDLAGKIEDAANWFSNLDENQRETIIRIGLVVAAIGPLLIVFGSLARAASSIVSTGASLINYMTRVGDGAGGAATKMQKLAAGAKLAAGVGGLLLVADATRRTASDMSTLEEALGGAAAGSMFGPWGAGIGFATGALHGLTRQDQAFEEQIEGTQTAVADYAGSFDGLTGSITGSTRALAAHALEESGVLETANKYGISSKVLVDAVLGEGKASETASRQIDAIIKSKWAQYHQIQNTKGTAAASASGITAEIKELEKLNDAVGENTTKLGSQLAAKRREIEAVRGGTLNVQDYRKALKSLPPKVQTKFDALGADATRRDVIKLGHQYKLTPRKIRTVLTALGFDEAKKKADDAKDHIKGVEKVRPNMGPFASHMRTEMAGVATDTSSKAKGAKEGIERPLSAIHPSLAWKSTFIGGIHSALNEAQETASGGGSQIGASLSIGIGSGITANVQSITNAASAAVAAGIAAARTRADAHSPSREMMKLGNDMGEGLALGMDEKQQRVSESFRGLVARPGTTSGARSASPAPAAARGGGRLRIVLDVGGGRSFNGWIQDEFDGRDELAGTTRRMRR